jgi:hypothetical protein
MQRAPRGLVYTILVDGRPIVTLEASSREAARMVSGRIVCAEFKWRTDLRDLTKYRQG